HHQVSPGAHLHQTGCGLPHLRRRAGARDRRDPFLNYGARSDRSPWYQLSKDAPGEDLGCTRSMKKLFYAATAYLVLGLASGMFYREFTQAQGVTAADGFTQLSVVHTHLLTLGMIVLLIVLVLERVFALSRSALFGWFFWIYNLGL